MGEITRNIWEDKVSWCVVGESLAGKVRSSTTTEVQEEWNCGLT